jgi:branched-chain amino acid transport system ATP-binding protein
MKFVAIVTYWRLTLGTLEPLLTVRSLRAGYGTKEILRGVDFAIRRGEIVTLLGANGSGKSTCLNVISGFVPPTAGEIMLEGKPVGGIAIHHIFRAGVVQVSQARDLFLDLTVESNLRLGALACNRSGIEAGLRRVFAIFPRLEERSGQHVRTLSGGEQQMVAVGRALMAEPKVLLLDEPSGGLSPQFVNEIAATMKSLKDARTTMLMVEQNLRLAFEVADRFIILRDGVVIDGGAVEALRGSHEDIVRSIYL